MKQTTGAIAGQGERGVSARSGTEFPMKSGAGSILIAWTLVFCLAMPAVAQSGTQPQATAPPAATTTSGASQDSTPAAGSSANTAAPSTPAASSSTADGSPADTGIPPESVTATGTPAGVKSGSKSDVDKIGERNVGGRGIGDWYSIETEMKMGKQYAMMVEQTARLVQDPVINEYVNRIGQNLVRNSDAKVPFTIKVIDSDEINAFALPGGFFYVNSGLILAADEEAELAGVMAHEIAHVAARHQMQQMTRMQYARMATIPLIFVGSWGVYEAASIAINLALPITFMKFSRDFESEADYLGVQYMYKSGYDPQAFISFFEKIEAKDNKKPGTIAKVFASHPPTPDRIARTQAEIKRILPTQPQYIVSTSEFDLVQARLASIQNRKKAVPNADPNKPTLRRTTADNKPDATTQQPDDDRPTLNKRDD
ncbi:MAG TPA: M48 family metallopeptidase [Candidatus Angelobacter sp.]|nr:M48 family metallopeptidase [Candidatus Angelobacter sp.]